MAQMWVCAGRGPQPWVYFHRISGLGKGRGGGRERPQIRKGPRTPSGFECLGTQGPVHGSQSQAEVGLHLQPAGQQDGGSKLGSADLKM